MKKTFIIDTTYDDMIDFTNLKYEIKKENGEKYLYIDDELIGAVINQYKNYDEFLDKETQYIFITRTF